MRELIKETLQRGTSAQSSASTVEPRGEARLVRVSGDLDLCHAGRLRSETRRGTRADGVATLL